MGVCCGALLGNKRLLRNGKYWDFPGYPLVKNLHSNAADAGSIPGWGTKIPHAAGQLSPCATAREKPAHCTEEPAHCSEGSHMLQLRPDAAK